MVQVFHNGSEKVKVKGASECCRDIFELQEVHHHEIKVATRSLGRFGQFAHSSQQGIVRHAGTAIMQKEFSNARKRISFDLAFRFMQDFPSAIIFAGVPF